MFPMGQDGPLNNSGFGQDQFAKFPNDSNNNPFFNPNECFGFPQNMQPSNAFMMPQQPQGQQIFNNGMNGLQQKTNGKNDEKGQIFNAQSLAYSENFNPRSYIKNTYINKINNLMSNSMSEFKASEEKKFFLILLFMQINFFFLKNRKVMIKIEPNLKLSTNNVTTPTDDNKLIKEEDIDMSKMSELGNIITLI